MTRLHRSAALSTPKRVEAFNTSHFLHSLKTHGTVSWPSCFFEVMTSPDLISTARNAAPCLPTRQDAHHAHALFSHRRDGHFVCNRLLREVSELAKLSWLAERQIRSHAGYVPDALPAALARWVPDLDSRC